MFRYLITYKKEFTGRQERINLYLLYSSTVINGLLLPYWVYCKLDDKLSTKVILLLSVLLIIFSGIISRNCTLKAIYHKRSMGRYYEKVIGGNPMELIKLKNVNYKYLVIEILFLFSLSLIPSISLNFSFMVSLWAVIMATNISLALIYSLLLILSTPFKATMKLIDKDKQKEIS